MYGKIVAKQIWPAPCNDGKTVFLVKGKQKPQGCMTGIHISALACSLL